MTMSDEILSQDEVDALLKGVTGEEDIGEEEPILTGIQPYNLAKQERIVRGRMPALEIINERFARLFRMSLYNFTRRTFEISVGQIKVQKYQEFMRNLVVPTNINIAYMRPLRGMCLVIFDPSLIFLAVDNLFGGDGRFHTRIEGREFTATEQRIIQRLLSLVFNDYAQSWKNIKPIEFEFIRSEINPQFANIATPTEVVVTTSFPIEIGATSGALHICLPYSMIEPVRDQLMSSMHGETMDTDDRWANLLRHQLSASTVELRSMLTTLPMTIEDLISMEVGDILPAEIPSEVIGTVDNVEVLAGTYGTHGGHYALKITRLISHMGPSDP